MQELLKTNDMDTIIIFTKRERIYQCQDYKLSWIPDAQSPRQIFVSNDKSFIIAYDEVLDFTKLVDLFDIGTNVYILHHKYPDANMLNTFVQKLSEKNCAIKNIVPKQHDGIEYRMIQNIDACVSKDKGYSFEKPNQGDLTKAFDALKIVLSGNPKLESALEFLHECLVRKPENLSLLEDFDLDFLCKMGKAKGKTINKLWDKLNKNPNEDIETFEALRDGVLEVGVIRQNF